MTPVMVRIPDDLRDLIDAVRGDVPRERWIRRTLEAALSSSETPEEALNRIAQSSPEELGMSRSQARMNAVQRGSASPSLERFSKAQRKGGKG